MTIIAITILGVPQKYEEATVCEFAWWTRQHQKASLYLINHKTLKVIHNVIGKISMALVCWPFSFFILCVAIIISWSMETHKASLSLNVWFGASFKPWTGTQGHLTDSVSPYHASWPKTQNATLSINWDIKHVIHHKIYNSERTIWT